MEAGLLNLIKTSTKQLKNMAHFIPEHGNTTILLNIRKQQGLSNLWAD